MTQDQLSPKQNGCSEISRHTRPKNQRPLT
jgi:hypothetical protein